MQDEKFLYGLKKSPRMWYQKFDTYLLGIGFTRRKEDMLSLKFRPHMATRTQHRQTGMKSFMALD